MSGYGSRIIIIIANKIVIVFGIFVLNSSNNLEFATEDHREAVTSDGFFDTRDSSTVSPFVDFTAESIYFMFKDTKLARCEHTMTTGSMNVSNRRVDDGRFGGTTDLREIRQKSRKILFKKKKYF